MIDNTMESMRQTRPSNSNARNIRKLLLMMRRNWYVYLVALVVMAAGALLYLKFKIPTYYADTTILVSEENSNAPVGDMLEGFALRPGVQNLDNQMVIVNSYSMIRKAVNELPFGINVFRKGLRREASYYPLSPIRIEPGSTAYPENQVFVFKYLEDNNFELTAKSPEGVELDTILRFGQNMDFLGRSFVISPQPELEDIYKSGKKIYIRFSDKEKLTEVYLDRLKVENPTRDGSVIRLSLEGPDRIKDVIFLDKLTEVYIADNLEKKNLEANRITDFIDIQIGNVSDSLALTETRLQDFRSRNRIMDVSAQAQAIIDQAAALETETARLTLQRNYFLYLEEYLSREDTDEAPMAPASMGIEDPLLANLLQELAGLQAEYYSNLVGDRNPLQGQLELRIRNTKSSIRENLVGIKLANQMALDENRQQINRINAEASGLPVKERQLLGFQREFNLNNELYTFLLQRQAEAQIQSASNAPDNELIDRARSIGPISPNPTNSLAFALALTLLIPTLIFWVGLSVKNKITSEEDLDFIVDIPIVAYFPHSRLGYNTIVLMEPDSRVSEAFRSLRTRMDYFTKDKKCPLITISSSMPGEGKTFAAINLASAYSLAGKKTLLVGFDLRRPTLNKSFEVQDADGITSYLIGRTTLDKIIYETNFDNLYIIPSGPVPPNPGELSSSDQLKEMVAELREKFDYIIVDSAPIGIVSDIYPLANMSDSLLMIVRNGHTKKNILTETLSEIRELGIQHLSLLVNDVKSRGSHYRYSYKYKYDYKPKLTLADKKTFAIHIEEIQKRFRKKA